MTFIGKILQLFNPNYSYCEKCGYTWNYCKSKTVMVSEQEGTFATCEKCWSNSTLDELKTYYTMVYKKQELSLRYTEFKMEYPLGHLLKCVEIEYLKQNQLP